MPKAIWKFPLYGQANQTFLMPRGARILHIAEQAGTVSLWAEVDPMAENSGRIIQVFGTGHAMPDDPGKYIGTFLLHEGSLVFHAYEKDG